ncbi:DUF397 domain-containing protein [Streptomyces fenghuangensis]|uniref:DUF397 domain-containing protein n=1 Tax=Streptomyces chitinivorans TaxID=1257027 RepID=A0ABW7HZ44_9ACTN|nr:MULTISPECIES: DUF397 domain-containing protein [Streptomyces]MBN3928896.1 DUF397 domain-containing protein [Streptomyces verrucosisporus]MCG3039667.1 DUF397 domain-containing protein [Streptomyces sp. ICN903]MDH2411107.1 DUF397 domain-containing protein [Streptomyces chitinivorans]
MAIRQGMTDRWTKSSHSAGNGACVEVRSPEPRAVAVRDSKVPQGPSLDFVPGSWTAFVGALGQGSLARR